ncbi:uncharacterized protein LOC126262936 isoform X1 [Schistocerca nitens]|uniref:uncharacterized protein LOC126262936 isoform X1 n=1 Tax=Schistocerca nitens TaxID=7011 RepID=UPI00211779C9|nr:uncharacterized protein LOC126262936 isoform X1 [Schistocerca nitens]
MMPGVMSNQHSRLSLNKRPFSFLGNDPQVKKDFGTNSKKPRLDITLTPSCSTKPPLDESSFNASSTDPYDDVWDEDLSEDVVEECFLLATQASQSCAEETRDANVVKTKNKYNEKNVNSFETPAFLQPPAGSFSFRTSNNQPKSVTKQSTNVENSKFKVPTTFQTSKLPPQVQKFQPKKPSNLVATTEKPAVVFPISSVPVGEAKASNKGFSTTKPPVAVKEDLSSTEANGLRNLKEENERLQDTLLSKEGEVSLLRSQIKKLQMQLETQHQESAREAELQVKRFSEQIETYKKELEITKTELQFKIIEATAVQNHSKIVESSSKLKLVEPEAAVMDTSCFTEHLHAKRSPKKLHTHMEIVEENENTDFRAKMDSTHQLQQLPQISEGAKLGNSLTESLQELPVPEVDWLHYIRQTEKFRSTAESARGINTKIVALQHHPFTIHDCIAQMIKLVAMTSLSSPQAGHLISQVVLVCRNILCRQVHILRLLQQVQSTAEWHELDEKVASLVGTMAAPEDADPLTSRSWYNGEQGIETRRAFGLLETLCASSQFAADLLSGTSAPKDIPKPAFNSHIDSSSESIVKKTIAKESTRQGKNVAPAVTNSSAEMDTDSTQSSQDVMVVEPVAGPSGLTERHAEGVDTELHLLLKQIPAIPRISAPEKLPLDLSDFISDQHGFLRLCLEVASQISLQRRTHSYVGVLTCMIRMLRAVALKSSFTKRGLQIVLEIMRDVVFSCPQADVVAAIIALLANTSQHIFLMDKLCHGSLTNTLVDRQVNEVVYFSRESCVMQVLFRLVPTNCTSLSFRTFLCSNLVEWLAGLIFQQKHETVWMRATGPARECSCKAKLIHTLVTVLYESFNDLQDLHSQGQHSSVSACLGRHLCVGVRLLHGLLQQDELIGSYLDGVEGQYQLFLTGLRDAEDMLTMSDSEKKCLKELLEVEIVTSDGVIAVPIGDEDMDTSSMKITIVENKDDDSLWENMNTLLQWDTKLKPKNV